MNDINDLFGLELDDLGKAWLPKKAKKPTPEQTEAMKTAFQKILQPLAKTTAGKIVQASLKEKVSNAGGLPVQMVLMPGSGNESKWVGKWKFAGGTSGGGGNFNTREEANVAIEKVKLQGAYDIQLRAPIIPANQKGNPKVQAAINARIDADLAAREAKSKQEVASVMAQQNPDSVESLEAKAEAEIAMDEGKQKEAEAIKSAQEAVESATEPQPEPTDTTPEIPVSTELTYDQKMAMTQILPGLAPMSTITARWNAMSQTQKIAIVGGGIAVTGLVIYLVYRATRPPQGGQ